MTFTVTYRAKDGALREERVEAANRAECVAECRRRGIAPVSIAERGSAKDTGSGLRRTSGGARSGKSAASPRWAASGRGAALVLIAAAIAGGVWWWMGRGGRDEARPSQVEKPKAAKAEGAETASVRQQGGKVQEGKPQARGGEATNAPAASMGADSAKPAKDEIGRAHV